MIRFLLIFLLWPATTFAEDWSSSEILPAGIKLIAALIIVLGILLILYYISRKGFGFLPVQKNGAIKTLEVRHLMPKRSLFLVEVRGKELLLGVGADRIELISHIDWSDKTSFEETLSSTIEEEK